MVRNFGQRRCRYCGSRGGDFGRHFDPCLTRGEVQALVAYADKHGTRWRAALRAAWARGDDVLPELRRRVDPAELNLILKTRKTR